MRLGLLGCGAFAAGAALALWPFDKPGLAGNALRPRHRDFGWTSYEPLPEHPTRQDFRRAGIPVPRDALARRRVVAGAAAAAGFALIALASRSQ
jgi:hypothetical protein